VVADRDIHSATREGQRDGATEPDGAAGHERARPFLDASPSL